MDSLNDYLDATASNTTNGTILSAVSKAYDVIHNGRYGDPYKVISVSVSGGSDSDLMVDMVHKARDHESDIHYCYYDTGMEYEATKRHLDYLEARYGIKIERYKSKIPVPLAVKKAGQPFLSKRVSQYIYRLQKHDFQWEDEPLEDLLKKYPNCRAALRWWCNDFGENSQMNIDRNRYLKQFMVENPPWFQISDKCCEYAKKSVAHDVDKSIGADLTCIGVRKAEGGVRSASIHECFSPNDCGKSVFRPVFWLTNKDKKEYEKCNGIIHSDCYAVYGLDRTGCACCPFGKYFEMELKAAAQHEPKLYKAARNVFSDSYEYTRMYRTFADKKRQCSKNEPHQITWEEVI